MSATISEQLADFLLELKFDQLSGDTVGMAKRCFLDWLGSAIAGAPAKPTEAMLAVARDLGGNEEATLVPNGRKTSAFLAALVNGAASHVVEMDDLHKGSIVHPAAPVIPSMSTEMYTRTGIPSSAGGFHRNRSYPSQEAFAQFEERA